MLVHVNKGQCDLLYYSVEYTELVVTVLEISCLLYHKTDALDECSTSAYNGEMIEAMLGSRGLKLLIPEKSDTKDNI